MTRKPVTIHSVLDDPLYTEPYVVAVKALASGTAGPDQQRMALEYIVTRVARANDITFTPDKLGGSRDQDFKEGMRFVGYSIRKIVETPLDVLVPERVKS